METKVILTIIVYLMLGIFKVRILNNPVGLISIKRTYSSFYISLAGLYDGISADVKIRNNYIITNNIIGHKSNNSVM